MSAQLRLLFEVDGVGRPAAREIDAAVARAAGEAGAAGTPASGAPAAAGTASGAGAARPPLLLCVVPDGLDPALAAAWPFGFELPEGDQADLRWYLEDYIELPDHGSRVAGALETEHSLQASLQTWIGTNNEPNQAGSYVELGRLYLLTGDLERAEPHAQRSREIDERLADVRRLSATYQTLKLIARARGDEPRAAHWEAQPAAANALPLPDEAQEALTQLDTPEAGALQPLAATLGSPPPETPPAIENVLQHLQKSITQAHLGGAWGGLFTRGAETRGGRQGDAPAQACASRASCRRRVCGLTGLPCAGGVQLFVGLLGEL